MTDVVPFVPIETAAESLGVDVRLITDLGRVRQVDLAAYQQDWPFCREEHLEVVGGLHRWTELPSFRAAPDHPRLSPGLVLLPADAGHIALTQGRVAVRLVHSPARDVRYTLVGEQVLVLADIVMPRVVFDQLLDDRSSSPDLGAPGRPSMTRQKGRWTIHYGGESCVLAERSGSAWTGKGLRYLAELLRRPNTTVPAVLLEAVVQGREMTPAQVAEADRGHEVVDQQGIEEVGRELLGARARAERARETGRFAVAETLEEQVEQLVRYLRQVTDRAGRPRRVGGRGRQAGTNVKKAIDRVIGKIRDEGLAELADHLSGSVRGGRHAIYAPAEDPGWLVGID